MMATVPRVEQLSKREAFMLLTLYTIKGTERYALRLATKLNKSPEYIRSTLNVLRDKKYIIAMRRRREHKVYYLQPERGVVYPAIQKHFQLRTIGVAANKKNFDGFIARFKTKNEL